MVRIMSALRRCDVVLCLGALVICLVHLPSQLVAADVSKQANLDTMNSRSDSHLLPAFLSSLSITLVSEFGDKTFFIAAILAMKSSRLRVFLGCVSALFVMTLLSVGLGFAVNIIPAIYTHYVSIALFVLFGSKMLYEGYCMRPDEGLNEYRAVERTILGKEDSRPEKGSRPNTFWSGAFWEAFMMIFLAEWGDRSQISTIVLAARDSALMVATGTISGHSICTALAVVAGSFVAERVSVKNVVYIGGIFFLIFAAVGAKLGHTDEPVL